MLVNDRQYGRPLVLYQDTQANVEALSGDAVAEGAVAYATDTDQIGTYDGSAWQWGSAVSALDDLSDVTLTSPALADRLRYDGSAWRNSALRWEPVTNGDAASPELVFAGGDVVMVEA
jgi:hypothetical protein